MAMKMTPQIYTQSQPPFLDDNEKMHASTTSTPNTAETSTDSKSVSSARSRGSAVLQRAREYNRIIDENRSRSKSVERTNGEDSEKQRSPSQPRSSNGKTGPDQSQRERAMASVKSENVKRSSVNVNTNANANVNAARKDQAVASTNRRSSPTPSQKSSNRRNSSRPSSSPQQTTNERKTEKSSSGKSNTHRGRADGQPIVTPELLVDALSGHEDGLLAIAERLMEHYDTGYDAMGEAIIDAFADVQKLFQHVVEAAHMEGAAYEAGRKEEEIERLKRALGGEGAAALDYGDSHNGNKDKGDANGKDASPTTPLRHEEFIDQDVRDVLTEAIRKGKEMKDANKYADCFQIYEIACNGASSLLPVDSDHRGRLQLSIARAESMSPERACAILRYVMDDVLRSGLNSNSKVFMPDPSQRGDCVLTRPESAGSGRFTSGQNVASDEAGVLQSSDEALASMVEEMKDILNAPVYDNSPLQNVAERFWAALSEAQRSNLKNEERLEQKLAILKAEFLIAREVSLHVLVLDVLYRIVVNRVISIFTTGMGRAI